MRCAGRRRARRPLLRDRDADPGHARDRSRGRPSAPEDPAGRPRAADLRRLPGGAPVQCRGLRCDRTVGRTCHRHPRDRRRRLCSGPDRPRGAPQGRAVALHALPVPARRHAARARGRRPDRGTGRIVDARRGQRPGRAHGRRPIPARGRPPAGQRPRPGRCRRGPPRGRRGLRCGGPARCCRPPRGSGAHVAMSAAARALGRPAAADAVADLVLAAAERRPLPDRRRSIAARGGAAA